MSKIWNNLKEVDSVKQSTLIEYVKYIYKYKNI